ncbi:MAG TPA: protein kinase [Thermoanaerobaculia bacterium]
MPDSLVGRSLGPYRIVAPLGAGGMGEVFVASDDRLGRRVALKILPPDVAEDASRRARFVAEARAASALHHPNIVTIFDIGQEEGHDWYTMELVDGDTLRELLAKGKLTRKRAIAIAADLCAALAAGHAAGIVHRDVKPENVVVARDGTAKLLDFGVAKLVSPFLAAIDSVAATDITPAPTMPGKLIGTVAYMSPEQAQGMPVDHRSDIFSAGVVLYEMIARRQPFASPSAIDQLHKIINVDPPPLEDPRLAEIAARALAKDPAHRYASAHDMRLDLLAAAKEGVAERALPRSRAWIALGVLALLAAVAATWTVARATGEKRDGTAAAAPAAASDIRLTPLTLDPGYEGEPSFSPDGKTLAYVSDRSGNLEIYLKKISGGADINLTDDPAADAQPAFSPDGDWIAFVSSRASRSSLVYRSPSTPRLGGDIWVMPALGGMPRRIVQEANFPSWSPDSRWIYFSAGPPTRQHIYRVPREGGKREEIPIRFANQNQLLFARRYPYLFYPTISPNGRWLLFAAQSETVFVVPAAGGAPREISRGRLPSWSSDGTAILFTNTDAGRNLSLWQIGFDPATGTPGSKAPLTVGRGTDEKASMSGDGKAIAFGAEDVTVNVERIPLDEAEGVAVMRPEPVTYGRSLNYFFDVAPRGSAIVFERLMGTSTSIWRKDLGSPPVQLTSDERTIDRFPSWSPDGTKIAFVRRAADDSDPAIFVMSADGASPERITESLPQYLAWSPDSTSLAYTKDDRLHLVNVATRAVRVVPGEPRLRQWPYFSPDGKWVVAQLFGGESVDIDAVDVERGGSMPVVALETEDYHPIISASGRWLYFQPDHKNIWRLPGPAQGWRKAAPQRVTNFPEDLYIEAPRVSSDGKWLYYSRVTIESDLWLIRR